MASYSQLSVSDRINLAKLEFGVLVKSIFENPELLKPYVGNRMISLEQAKAALKAINRLNGYTCVCCRLFDQSKLSDSPIDKDLRCLIDIVQTNLNAKRF